MRLTSSQAATVAKLAKAGPVELEQDGRDVRVATNGQTVTVGARGAVR
jgi:hypothetical protein